MALDPTHTALGTWSGGRFMHFGAPLDDERLLALFRPDERIRTVLTADVYGEGAADTLLGQALTGLDRDAYCLVGALGHDFYDGEREGAKGFPRFTDPRLRGPEAYGDYAPRRTTPPTCGPPRSAACSASAPTPSTSCCCTTPTARATRPRRSGRAWPRCATRASRA
jgi:hypothetical protein